MSDLYRIDTGYACFGLVVEAGIVVEAPPIAGWAKGRPIRSVIDYYVTKKKATYLAIHEKGESTERSI